MEPSYSVLTFDISKRYGPGDITASTFEFLGCAYTVIPPVNYGQGFGLGATSDGLASEPKQSKQIDFNAGVAMITDANDAVGRIMMVPPKLGAAIHFTNSPGEPELPSTTEWRKY